MTSRTQPRLKLQLRLLLADEIAFGPGKADLLETIARTGSISSAAAAMGMSYRRAWLLVDAMNRCFRQPLVDSATGGTHGGGATLTRLGRQVLARYRRMERDAEASAAAHFKSLRRLLRARPLPPAKPRAAIRRPSRKGAR